MPLVLDRGQRLKKSSLIFLLQVLLVIVVSAFILGAFFLAIAFSKKTGSDVNPILVLAFAFGGTIGIAQLFGKKIAAIKMELQPPSEITFPFSLSECSRLIAERMAGLASGKSTWRLAKGNSGDKELELITDVYCTSPVFPFLNVVLERTIPLTLRINMQSMGKYETKVKMVFQEPKSHEDIDVVKDHALLQIAKLTELPRELQ